MAGITYNPNINIFVRDLVAQSTKVVNLDMSGTATGNGPAQYPSISADGHYIAFMSSANNLVANDHNNGIGGGAINDIFIRNMQTGVTTLVSINNAGTDSGNSGSTGPPNVSADGRFVLFPSSATDLCVTPDFDSGSDLFLRDMQNGVTRLVTVNTSGFAVGLDPADIYALSADGHHVIFTSLRSDLVPVDTNGLRDVFARAIPNPTATLIQFGTANYMVGEGDLGVTINVTRTGDTSGPSTVDYRTTDTDTFTVNCGAKQGQAYGRCDFATVVGTLSFAAGEASKSFNVPIINDSWAEGAETFGVALSNPRDASLGSQSTATVTINDNETTEQPNPILQTNSVAVDFFVRQHYLDFLGREPEPAQPWSNVLNGCADQFNVDPNSPSASCDRITVSGAFFGSPEFKDKGFYVIDFYRVGFGRLPQYSEFVTDLASLVGSTAQEVFARRVAYANNFVQRPEFASIAALSNSSYVMTLMAGTNGQNYSLTSITTPDLANPDGATKVTLTTNDLINELNANTLTKAQVLRAIVQSDEIINTEAVSTFVASQYYGYLRRTPEPAGFNSWVNYLTLHPTDFHTMVNGFLNSIEYRLRFGPS